MLRLKNYTWLLYPVGVLLGIGLSAGILFGNLGLWTKLSQASADLKVKQATLGKLKDKLAKLQQLNPDAENQNLEYLITVLPPYKNLTGLVDQLSLAAGKSGAEITGYSGQVASGANQVAAVGLELTVNLSVADLTQLKDFAQQLETSLPLISITEVKFTAPTAVMRVRGEWAPFESLPGGADYPVTDTGDDLAELKSLLASYWSVPTAAEVALPDLGVNPNPF